MVFAHELRKTIASPAILGVALVALLFNIATIFIAPLPTWFDDQAVPQMTNIYEGFSAESIAEEYITESRANGEDAERIRDLYMKLQQSIDEKALHGDAMDPYLELKTEFTHEVLYGQVFPVSLIGIGVLVMLLGMFSIGYDAVSCTDKLLWSSVVGRKIWGWKLLASLLSSLGIAAVILGATVAVFCWRFSYGGWSSQVSSGFNFAVHDIDKPFITWDRLTVGGYLSLSLLVALGVVVCFCLLGAVIATFIRNPYAAVVAGVMVLATMILVPLPLPVAGLPKAVLLLTPLQLILQSGQWFTDGGVSVIWPRFETLGLLASLLVLGCFVGASALRVKKEDLT